MRGIRDSHNSTHPTRNLLMISNWKLFSPAPAESPGRVFCDYFYGFSFSFGWTFADHNNQVMWFDYFATHSVPLDTRYFGRSLCSIVIICASHIKGIKSEIHNRLWFDMPDNNDNGLESYLFVWGFYFSTPIMCCLIQWTRTKKCSKMTMENVTSKIHR